MSVPVPKPGLVIRYAYLWEAEARQGREEGTKDRPCAIVLVVLREGDHPIVRVLPVTHTPPSDPRRRCQGFRGHQGTPRAGQQPARG